MLMREKKPKHRKQDDEEDEAEESFEESSLEEVENDDAVKVKVADAEEADVPIMDVCSLWSISSIFTVYFVEDAMISLLASLPTKFSLFSDWKFKNLENL